MAFTQADLDALDEEFKQGKRVYQFSDGRRIELFSMDDYLKLRSQMMSEITASTSPTPAVRSVRVYQDDDLF